VFGSLGVTRARRHIDRQNLQDPARRQTAQTNDHRDTGTDPTPHRGRGGPGDREAKTTETTANTNTETENARTPQNPRNTAQKIRSNRVSPGPSEAANRKLKPTTVGVQSGRLTDEIPTDRTAQKARKTTEKKINRSKLSRSQTSKRSLSLRRRQIRASENKEYFHSKTLKIEGKDFEKTESDFAEEK
jgi:hypothetical protein